MTRTELGILIAVTTACAGVAWAGFVRYTIYSDAREARTNVRSVWRQVHAAYERELPTQADCFGGPVYEEAHMLCDSASPVPMMPEESQYAPSATPGEDFLSGSEFVGWGCLHVTLAGPLKYQYAYERSEDEKHFVVTARPLDGVFAPELIQRSGYVDEWNVLRDDEPIEVIQ